MTMGLWAVKKANFSGERRINAGDEELNGGGRGGEEPNPN